MIDETTGAIVFIAVVLLWYASSIAILLAMETRSSSETVEDSVKRPTELFTHGFSDRNSNKEVLGRSGWHGMVEHCSHF